MEQPTPGNREGEGSCAREDRVRFRDRRPEAWQLVFHQWFPVIYRYVALHTGAPREEVEDLCSEVWLQAVASAGSYDPARGSPGRWLMGICRNVLASRALTSRGDPLRERVSLQEEKVSTPDSADGQREALARAYQASVRQMDREVLESHYLDGLALAEVAGRHGLSKAAAERFLRRGRLTLRRLFRSFDRRTRTES